MITVLERAKQALAHHDKFNRFGDNHALYMFPGAETLYELPHNDGQFTLADLRALVDYAERSPRVGDGSGDAAIAIAEEAFKAGFGAGYMPVTRNKEFIEARERAWNNFEPSEAMKALS